MDGYPLVLLYMYDSAAQIDTFRDRLDGMRNGISSLCFVYCTIAVEM